MNFDDITRLAAKAVAIKALALFVVFSDQNRPTFHCRFWGALGQLNKEQAERLVTELNAAIAPVTQKWVDEIASEIREATK